MGRASEARVLPPTRVAARIARRRNASRLCAMRRGWLLAAFAPDRCTVGFAIDLRAARRCEPLSTPRPVASTGPTAHAGSLRVPPTGPRHRPAASRAGLRRREQAPLRGRGPAGSGWRRGPPARVRPLPWCGPAGPGPRCVPTDPQRDGRGQPRHAARARASGRTVTGLGATVHP